MDIRSPSSESADYEVYYDVEEDQNPPLINNLMTRRYSTATHSTMLVADTLMISMMNNTMESDSTALKTEQNSLLKNKSYSPSSTTNPRQRYSDPNAPTNRKRLLIAVFISFFFFLMQFIGGFAANSLAIVADSFHLLTDCAAYIISLLSVILSTRKAGKRFTFGYARVEVLGATISVLLIWVLTGFLVAEAIQRLRMPEEKVNGPIMLGFSSLGLFINMLLLFVLGHGNHGGHGHHHHHHHDHEHGDGENHHHNSAKHNLNVRAAFIHALGDMLGSISVVASSVILIYYPHLTWIDPVCTFVFSLIVLVTTYKIAKDIFMVIAEAAPVSINIRQLQFDLTQIDQVDSIHELRVWSLTSERTTCMVHAVVPDEFSFAQVQKDIKSLFRKVGITESTVQVEIRGVNVCPK